MGNFFFAALCLCARLNLYKFGIKKNTDPINVINKILVLNFLEYRKIQFIGQQKIIKIYLQFIQSGILYKAVHDDQINIRTGMIIAFGREP